MKIKTKLTLLTAIVAITALATSAVLLIFLAPILNIQQEQIVLFNLMNAENRLSVAVLQLPNEDYSYGKERLADAIDAADASFDEVDGFDVLPGLSAEIAEALDTISQLRDLQTDRVNQVNKAIDSIDSVLESSASQMTGLVLNDFRTRERYLGIEDTGQVRFRIDQLSGRSMALVAGLEAIRDTLAKQTSVIEDGIQSVIRRSIIYAAGIALLLISASVVISLTIGVRINRSVRKISGDMESLKKGNLSLNASVQSGDEIGDLGRGLIDFVDNLSISVRNIKKSAGDNRSIQGELSGATIQSLAASEEMQANASAIENQIRILDSNIENSTDAVTTINDSLGSMETDLAHQDEIVGTTSSSVTEMLASVDSVGSLTRQSGQAASNLESAAQQGGGRIHETTSTIASIRDGIDGVRNITSIIHSIASRTNLLAMNAAIEAAHAGDSGRGFAVVADEIRKLAEASSANSKEISDLLNGMIGNIEKADESGQLTQEAFGLLDSSVKEVKRAISEIDSSMQEMEIGGSQIRSTVAELRDMTTRVGESSREVRDQSRAMEESVTGLKQVSQEVTSGISEISTGLHEMNESMSHLQDISDRINSVGSDLEDSVSVFHLEDIHTESQNH